VFSTKNCRSSFYAIAACGSAAIFLLQTTLNVLGSVDILPLTGVTVPFISNGGTSMITSWGLLALIKSAEWK
jgi:cell division protein FtsW (lipid II flippase)